MKGLVIMQLFLAGIKIIVKFVYKKLLSAVYANSQLQELSKYLIEILIIIFNNKYYNKLIKIKFLKKHF